jgi:nitrate/TMAO reductase-like tetraheme cytochrome c subunit
VTRYFCYTCHEPERTRTLHEAQAIGDIFAKCTDCHP